MRCWPTLSRAWNRKPRQPEGALHPLLEQRDANSHLVVLMTPDRGLCGGLNTNLIRLAGSYVASHENAKLVCVGRKGFDFFRRVRAEILGEFTKLGDYPSFDDVRRSRAWCRTPTPPARWTVSPSSTRAS